MGDLSVFESFCLVFGTTEGQRGRGEEEVEEFGGLSSLRRGRSH